jgi:hypothetical protein
MKHKLLALCIVNLAWLNPSFAMDPEIESVELTDPNGNKIESSDGQQLLMDAIMRSQNNKRGLLESRPTGYFPKGNGFNCDPRDMEKQYKSFVGSKRDRFAIIKKYWARCQDELSKDSEKGLLGLVNFGIVKYEVFEHPYVKRLLVTYRDGKKTHGFIGLQPGSTPRPMVILKCGLTCDGQDGAANTNFFMNLFDQSEFHVAVLANDSSALQAKTNNQMMFGGFHESLQILEFAKFIQSTADFKQKVSSVHLAGVSLGGSAALFSGLRNDQLRPGADKGILSSLIAICPAVDIHGSMKALFNGELVGEVMKEIVWQEMQESAPYLLDAQDLVGEGRRPASNQKFIEYMGEVATRYYQINHRLYNVLPFPTSTQDFFAYNNFLSYSAGLKTPLLVMASADDIVVDPTVNVDELAAQPHVESNDNYSILKLKYGSHCGMSSVYGLPAVATTMRSFVMAHADGAEALLKKYRKALSMAKLKLSGKTSLVGYEWRAEVGSNKLRLNFHVLNNAKSNQCRNAKPNTARKECIDEIRRYVPISEIGAFILEKPRNSAHAEQLTRWANSKLILKNNRSNLYGTQLNPTHVEWESFD